MIQIQSQLFFERQFHFDVNHKLMVCLLKFELQQSQKLQIEQEKLMAKHDDGWQVLSSNSDQTVHLVSLYKDTNGRNILLQQYSLEPDMATGWMPKLPSCPIPLTYQNNHIQTLIEKIDRDQKYEIVYRGMRCINSVQLHKKYAYKWRYRQKYDVKVNLISQAVQNIGRLEETLKINTLQDWNESQIGFDSDFQSGNLDMAVRVKKNEYDCFIRSDTNTRGHTNWYFFKVCNKQQIGTIQINICNIIKRKNLYGKGMTPYTLIANTGQSQNQWSQNQCTDVQFVERLCRYGTDKISNQLQFKFNFHQSNMEVFFAYSIPYTYTDLQNMISDIKRNPLVRVSELCQSFSGLDVPLLTISKQSSDIRKPIVIITGRIHPGETNSSHMMEGFIRSLLLQNQNSSKILSYCTFCIIPMINPDGVVVGNYRTSFSGRDLNRKFDQIGKFLYPEINGLVDLIRRFKKQKRKVQFFFDFHSHSSKKNLFCYGPEHTDTNLHFFRSRVFMKILEKQDTMFDYQKCIYTVSQHKKFTARAYMLRKQLIPMTFTFEISNGIYSLTKDVDASLDKRSLLQAGRIVYEGLCTYAHCYLRQYDNFKKLKKNSMTRLSLPINRKGSELLRKSIVMRRSQNLSASFEYLSNNNHEVKEMIDEIIMETRHSEMIQINQERYSDGQSSEDDIDDNELADLFDLKMKYQPDVQTLLGVRNESHKKNKRSLKNITNKSSIKKISKMTSEKSLTRTFEPQTENSSKPTSKYKKNRIYYIQTHPPSVKKTFDNVIGSKKAIKQKKFPILF